MNHNHKKVKAKQDRLEIIFTKMKHEPVIEIHITEILKRCLKDGYCQLGQFKITNDAVEGMPILLNDVFELRWRKGKWNGGPIADCDEVPLGGALGDDRAQETNDMDRDTAINSDYIAE